MSEIKLNEKQLKESALIDKIHNLQIFIANFLGSKHDQKIYEYKLTIEAEGVDQYHGYTVSCKADNETIAAIIKTVIDRKEDLLNELAIDRKEELLNEIPYSAK